MPYWNLILFGNSQLDFLLKLASSFRTMNWKKWQNNFITLKPVSEMTKPKQKESFFLFLEISSIDFPDFYYEDLFSAVNYFRKMLRLRCFYRVLNTPLMSIWKYCMVDINFCWHCNLDKNRPKGSKMILLSYSWNGVVFLFASW